MSDDSLITLAKRVSVSALHVVRAHTDGFSQIGGTPTAPPEFQWPEWNSEPLNFLAQLDLAEVASAHEQSWLPPTGYLYFFYDKEQSTWGFDPKDRGSWRVIYSTVERSLLKSAPMPIELDEHAFSRAGVRFEPIASVPDWQRMRDVRDFSEPELEAFSDFVDSVFQDQPKHQLFGYPVPVQSDAMELECQLASNGIDVGTQKGYQTPRAQQLASGASDWRLLLQLDSDDALGMMWGDAGSLYFWVREADAQAGNFDNVWMVLQCS